MENNENIEELDNQSISNEVVGVENSVPIVEDSVVPTENTVSEVPIQEDSVMSVIPEEPAVESNFGDASSEQPLTDDRVNTDSELDSYTAIGNSVNSDISQDVNLTTNENQSDVTPNEPEKKNKKNKGVLAIIIVLLVLALGAFCYFYVISGNKTEKVETNKTEVKSKYRMSGNGLEDFDLYFMQLENKEENKVYSPLSIKYALQMLSEGSSGATKAQLDSIIGEYKTKKYTNNDHMSFANAMFIRNTFKDAVKVSYIDKLNESYGAEVIFDEFKSPDNINSWVSDKTFKLINNLLNDVSGNTFFLINALAIDMNWNYQIHCATGSMDRVPCINEYGTYSMYYDHEKVEDDAKQAYHNVSYAYDYEDEFYHLTFNGKEKTKAATILADFNRYDIIKEVGEDNIRKTVREEYQKWLQTDEGKQLSSSQPEVANVDKNVEEYINEIKSNYGKNAISSDFMVYEDDNVRSFAKDLKAYDGVTLQYVGIMPKEKPLTDYVKNLKASDVNSVIKKLKELKIENFTDGVATIITGEIPLFKFDYELQLLDDLEKLGIKDVFDETKADLTKLTSSKGIHIDKAVHKATIEFSNEGIKAAAASVEGGAGASGGGFEYLYKIPVEKIDITFDKPYMYIIRDKDSGEVWFAGTVYEPISK